MFTKMFSRVALAAGMIVLSISINAMPSYDDVLIVVNDNSPQSLEIGNYFKTARNIPDINVCHISVTDLQAKGTENANMPLAERNSAVTAIQKYLNDNGLTGKINYIVLTRGIPYFSQNTTGYQLFDLYLLYKLSDSGSSSLIPDIFTYNKYYYYIINNYNNQIDYKFTQPKYGYYIISRLDGPGKVHIKKMIDDTAYPAYQSAKKEIKFFTMNPYFRYYTKIGDEIKARGNIKLVTPDLKIGEDVRDVGQDIMFGYWNRVYFGYDQLTSLTGVELLAPYYGSVFYGDTDTVDNYPNIYHGMTFLPGSIITCFRSFPALYNLRPNGGMFKFDPTALVMTDHKKSDGSDMKFRHMSCVEYDPVNNWVWCGTGDNPLLVEKGFGTTFSTSYLLYGTDWTDLTAHKYEAKRGGGIAIYSPNGNILSHLTIDNSPLMNNRVTKIAYDKHANRIWVAHYGGIQYYDLVSKTWSEVAALKNDFAATCGIYVDPYDTDKVYFSFYYSNYSLRYKNCSLIANADSSIFEYSKGSNIVKPYLIDTASVRGIAPLMVKTSANTLWVTKDIFYLYKYDLTTSKYTEKILIKDALTDIAALAALDKYTLMPPSAITAIPGTKTILVATSCRFNYKVPLVAGKPYETKNYLLRVTDNGAAPSTVEVVNNDIMNRTWTGISYNTIWSLISDPTNPNNVYMSFSDRAVYASGWEPTAILKSTDQGKNWTDLVPDHASKVPMKNLREITIAPDGNIFGVRGYENDQQAFSDFMVFGASAFGGGLSHDSFTYNPTPAAAPTGTTLAAGAYSSDTSAENEAYSMMLMMLDGYYMGEARYGIFKQYPATGGGGYVAHMLCFEPKCAPYAPRVDEENMNTMIAGKNTIEIPLRSPGLPLAMDGFIQETINSGTVTVTDIADAPVTPSEIKYIAAGRKIVLTGDFSAATYKVTLKCGINGIKNIKGASLTNTRVDEFKDEITLMFGDIPIFKPDLSISSITWTPVNPEIGKAVTLSVVIQNTGTIPASAGAVDIYFDGTKIGSVSYAAIPAAGNITKTFDVSASKITAGNHLVRVVADTTATSAEISETNNELELNMPVVVKPDLQITAIAFSPSAPSVTDNVIMTITVKNNGTGPTVAGTSDIKLDSVKIGAVSYGVLAAGVSQNYNYNISAGVMTVGAHTFNVAADATNSSSELDETNNTMNKTVTVTGKPELAISNLSWTPVSPAVGDTVSITARISNTGSASTVAGLVYFYLKGSNVGSVSYGVLTPGSFKDCTLVLNTKYLPLGSYAVKAFADGTNTTAEINETNNERASSIVFAGKADLIVRDFWWTPVPPVSGSGLNFQIALSNIGIAISAGTTVDLYIDDVKAGSASVTAMAVNENRTIPLTVTGDKVKGGSHNIKVVIDPNNLMAELQKTNNVRIESMAIAAPDLRVSNVQFVPVVPATGEKLQVKFLLDNTSTIPAPGSVAAILFDGVAVATVSCPPLAGKTGQVVTGEINGKFLTPGAHVVKVVADKNNLIPESSKTNNTMEARISVVFPDLSISTITISPANPVKGNNVTVAFTISNIGQAVANISGAEVFLDGAKVGSVNGGMIPAKGTKAMSVIIDGSKITAGAHLVKVYATLKDIIPELQTGNNLRTANFTAK